MPEPFVENQYPDWWVFAILALTGLGLPVLFFVLARWKGRQDARYAPGILLVAATIAFLLSAGIFACFGRMTTTVDGEQVRVVFGFVPAYSRSVPAGDIQGAEAIEYDPMREFGGWGIRGGDNNRVLSQKGNEAVRLRLPDNQTLLIGSQRPADLAEAIKAVTAVPR